MSCDQPNLTYINGILWHAITASNAMYHLIIDIRTFTLKFKNSLIISHSSFLSVQTIGIMYLTAIIIKGFTPMLVIDPAAATPYTKLIVCSFLSIDIEVTLRIGILAGNKFHFFDLLMDIALHIIKRSKRLLPWIPPHYDIIL